MCTLKRKNFTADQEIKEVPKKQRTANNHKPSYICGICSNQCLESENLDISQEAKYSVGCDKCLQWYHWGCVTFNSAHTGDWFCANCTNAPMDIDFIEE